MAVIKEARMPEPTDDKKEEPATSPPKSTTVDEIKKEYIDGMKLQAFKKGAGLEEEPKTQQQPAPAPIAKPEESIVGVSLKVLGEIMTKVIEQLGTLRQEAKPQEQPFYTELMKKFIDAQLTAKNESLDPLQAYQRVSEIISETQKMQAAHTGTPAITAEPAQLLQIQQQQNELRLKELQHEKEMKLLERQWRKEDQRWEQEKMEREQRFKLESEKWHWEMELRIAELTENRERKKKAMAALQQLAQGIAAGIRLEPDYPSVSAKAERQKEGDFVCPECGNKIPVYIGDEEIICAKEDGGCGKVYERKKE
jgi:hypothetical protein